MKNNLLIFVLTLIVAAGCSTDDEFELQFTEKNRPVPEFNVDSAYSHVVDQVEIGSRNPGSEGHRQAKEYLVTRLKAYAGNRYVFTQEFTHRGYEGDTLHMANIIASFNPGSSDRIMLCAHWDTRPRAEQDPSEPQTPILGADDGASGVAVLLEMARLFSEQNPPVGVDIVLFDGEDYGKEGDISQYFLGSRFWSGNPPVKNYDPRFAILLDMVGGENARFPKEGFSMEFAPGLVEELWAIADQKNYGSLFPDETGAKVSDDHVIVNRVRGIPTVNIIHHSAGPDGQVRFPPYWHTQNDNLDIIDRGTLNAVGEVLAELIYNRI